MEWDPVRWDREQEERAEREAERVHKERKAEPGELTREQLIQREVDDLHKLFDACRKQGQTIHNNVALHELLHAWVHKLRKEARK